MELPQTAQPQLTCIGATLQRSLQRYVIENDDVRSAFAELSFELELARQMGAPAPVPEMLEPTV